MSILKLILKCKTTVLLGLISQVSTGNCSKSCSLIVLYHEKENIVLVAVMWIGIVLMPIRIRPSILIPFQSSLSFTHVGNQKKFFDFYLQQKQCRNFYSVKLSHQRHGFSILNCKSQFYGKKYSLALF